MRLGEVFGSNSHVTLVLGFDIGNDYGFEASTVVFEELFACTTVIRSLATEVIVQCLV